MPRLILTRSVVSSLPSTTTPGVTNILRPQSVISRYLKLQYSGSWKLPQQPSRTAALADLFVAGHGFVEEIEEIVVHRHDALHELYVPHQARADSPVNSWIVATGAHAAGIERRRMDMTPFHQTKHFAGHAAHLQRFAVELAFRTD